MFTLLKKLYIAACLTAVNYNCVTVCTLMVCCMSVVHILLCCMIVVHILLCFATDRHYQLGYYVFSMLHNVLLHT